MSLSHCLTNYHQRLIRHITLNHEPFIFDRLPVELRLKILKLLDSKRTLRKLIKVSPAFRAVFEVNQAQIWTAITLNYLPLYQLSRLPLSGVQLCLLNRKRWPWLQEIRERRLVAQVQALTRVLRTLRKDHSRRAGKKIPILEVDDCQRLLALEGEDDWTLTICHRRMLRRNAQCVFGGFYRDGSRLRVVLAQLENLPWMTRHAEQALITFLANKEYDNWDDDDSHLFFGTTTTGLFESVREGQAWHCTISDINAQKAMITRVTFLTKSQKWSFR